MSQEIVKVDEDKEISLENLIYIKEEFRDEYYSDSKVSVFETTAADTVNISNSELSGHIKNDKIKEYGSYVDHIKADLPSSSEVKDRNIVKIEDGILPVDVKIEFCNEFLYCGHCHEVYQDYCTKCRVLVHILNQKPSHNIYDKVRELPKYMLETRESIGCLGIFCLKVIPEDVRFGPFTGLNSAGVPLRLKGGKFVISDEKSNVLNWMHYVNPARNIYEQNLFPFRYEDKLYYGSTRRIQKGEELLVYFGKEYDDNLLRDVEMDFVPIAKPNVENVFACTFCCLGFSTKKYLAEHKAACHGQSNEMVSVEELAQCPFCKIYLEAKEYFEHHKDYCCVTNAMCLIKRYDTEQRQEWHRETMASWIKGHTDCMSIASDSEIYCQVCETLLKNCNKSTVKRHVESLKHEKKLNPLESDNFNEELCETLMAANIPINKVNNPSFKKFLQKYTRRNIPDESTLRKYYVPKFRKQ